MSQLTTATKVKTYLGISGSTHDTLIDSLVTSASALVERYCNRNFTEGTYTQYFDTIAGDSKVFLKNYPVSSLTSVQYRAGTWGAVTWEDLNANDYLLNENGKVDFAFPFVEAPKYFKIVYVGGYKIDFNNESNSSLHTLPFDLTQIVTEIVAQQFNLRASAGIQSETTEGQSITYKDADTIMSFSKRLMPYRSLKI